MIVGTLCGSIRGHRDTVGMASVAENEDMENAALFDSPVGLCMDSESETLYILESGSHCIRKLCLDDGLCTTISGGRGAGEDDGLCAQFSFPHSICLVSDFLFIADTGNDSLRCFDLNKRETCTVWPHSTAHKEALLRYDHNSGHYNGWETQHMDVSLNKPRGVCLSKKRGYV